MKLKNSDVIIKKVKHKDLQKMYYGEDKKDEYIEGFYNPMNNTIYISDKSSVSTLYHEIAHAVFQKYYYNAVVNLINDTNITVALQEIIADCASSILKVIKDNEEKIEKIIKNDETRRRKNDKEKR